MSKPYASILHLETEGMEGREVPEKFSTIRGPHNEGRRGRQASTLSSLRKRGIGWHS